MNEENNVTGIEIEEPEELTPETEDTNESVVAGTEEKPKKRFPLQGTVIVALCLVVAVLLGYLTYTAFFLREPEGITWATELKEGEKSVTYYFEFHNDGTFTAYAGSVEFTGKYDKNKNVPVSDTTSLNAATADEKQTVNQITLYSQIAYFYPTIPAQYEITGSRLLGNQEMKCTYGEGFDFSFRQAERVKPTLNLPENFEAEKDLVGTWIFYYGGEELSRATFNADGSMVIASEVEGTLIRGTYTLSDGKVNFTYYLSEDQTIPLEYKVDGDTLTFLGATYVREGSDATVDQAIMLPME